MEIDSGLIKNYIMLKKEKEIEEALHSGWDPNAGGGWPIRLAARYGYYSIVETLIKCGANPHLLSASGASSLQLAVYSGEHWGSDRWSFLLSCCDSSQLADAAAVAIIFNNCAALEKILKTGRCNAHIPTTLTGKTLEELAKGYKMTHLLTTSIAQVHSPDSRTLLHSPNNTQAYRLGTRNALTPQTHQPQRNLSPSVARFFQQTAGQSSLTSPQSTSQQASPSRYFI